VVRGRKKRRLRKSEKVRADMGESGETSRARAKKERRGGTVLIRIAF